MKLTRKSKDYIKDLSIKLLKAMLKVGGFQGWLVGFIGAHFLEEIAFPVADAVLVEINYKIDVRDGKKMLVKLNEATNVQEYNDAVDDILGAD